MTERPFPAYEGDEPYFFVCYAHDDAAEVYQEMQWIAEAGYNLWYDDGIHVGTVWRRVLAEALEGATGLIFIQTANSVASEFCLNETRFALDEEKPIFILQLEHCALPAELRLSLGDRQALVRENLTPGAYRQKLINALGACLGGDYQPVARRPEPLGPAQLMRKRRTSDRENRILLSTVAAVEDSAGGAEPELLEALISEGGELLAREGNTVFAAFDSASRALATVSSLVGSVRAGISGGDLLFEDGMYHGSPMLEAAQLKKMAGSGEILCASRIADLVPWPPLQAGDRNDIVLTDGRTLSVVRLTFSNSATVDA